MIRKWQGTALFAVIMAAVSATVAGRLITGGGGVTVATPQQQSPGSGPSSDSAGNGATSGTTGAAPSPSSTAAPSSGGSSTSAAATITGDTEQTQYGAVQVSVTFSGSKIVSVQTLQAPMSGGRDRMLTQYATPQLAQEVVASQSAKVDTVSGATYTSEGYLASVQSAIDRHT